MVRTLRIPCSVSKGKDVEIFLDELDENSIVDVLDLLRSEMAPLKVFRRVATEYLNLGKREIFLEILQEVVAILDDEDTVRHYRKQGDQFKTDMAEIFEALAADTMTQLVRGRELGVLDSDKEKQLKATHMAFIGQADAQHKFHSYTFLIKGFYWLRVDSDVHRAASQFTIVHNKCMKDPAAEPYLCGALLGLGICAYAQGKYLVAFKHFTDALAKNNAGCHASVRVAIASCFYKLGEYTKAREATMNAIAMDAASPDSYCMLALIEQADAVKYKHKRAQHILHAYEYWTIATELDPKCAPAFLQRAYYHLTEWKPLGSCEVLNQGWIRVESSQAGSVEEHDRLLVDGKYMNAVKEYIPEEGSAMVTLAQPLAEEAVGGSITVMIKEFGQVLRMLEHAQSCTQSPQVLSEILFVKGRVHHERGDLATAQGLYEQSLEKWRDMDLSAFALGKILMSQDTLERPIELFEHIAKRNPHDKDTQAYLCLLQTLRQLRQPSTAAVPAKNSALQSFDRLKEIAVDFEFESNLWLAQAELRHRKPAEMGAALKCYNAALDCLRDSEDFIKLSGIISNIAVLQQGAGKSSAALESIKSCLAFSQKAFGTTGGSNPHFENTEFEGVFYEWAESACTQVRKGEAANSFLFEGTHPSLTAGELVLVGDVILTVLSVSDTGFEGYSPVDAFNVQGSDDESSRDLPLKQKVLKNNFNSNTTSLCFNYARILEDNGRVEAAKELYLAILKMSPALIEAYLRLSHISRNKGNMADALSWACRGLSIDENNADALVCVADLRTRGKEKKDRVSADAIMNELLKKGHKNDPRPLVLLGNQRFEDAKGADDEAVMSQCRKFFFTPLQKDPTNIFAANGLGMVCCEYAEYDVASEIFLRAKELGVAGSEDINSNLANVHLIQGRNAEAEHLFQLNVRKLTKTSGVYKPGSITYCSEMCAMTQFRQKRHEDAVRTLLRGLHQEPLSRNSVLRTWFNIALVRANRGHAVITTKDVKSVALVRNAIDEFMTARNIFSILAIEDISAADVASSYNPSKAKSSGALADDWLAKCDTSLEEAEKNEHAIMEERARRTQSHLERMKRQEEEKASALAAVAEQKAAKERQAAEKQKRLDELKAGWQAAHVISDKPQKGKGGKNAKAVQPEDVANYDSDDDLDISEGFNMKKAAVTDVTDEIDSDADDDIFGGGGGGGRKRAGSDLEEGVTSKKARQVVDSDDEDAQFVDDQAQASKEVDELFDSD